MVLPELSPEQRQAALAKAAAARQARADVKYRLKRYEMSLEQVLVEAQNNDSIARLRVRDLLQSMPGVGKVRAQEIMERIGIAPSRRIRGLGSSQAEAVVAEFRQASAVPAAAGRGGRVR